MASGAAGTEAVGRLEAALATAEATGVVAAPVASPLVDEGDTVGEGLRVGDTERETERHEVAD